MVTHYDKVVDGIIYRHQSMHEIMTLVTAKLEEHKASMKNALPMRLATVAR